MSTIWVARNSTSILDGRLNNVDVRYNFPIGADLLVDIVAATNRVNPKHRVLSRRPGYA